MYLSWLLSSYYRSDFEAIFKEIEASHDEVIRKQSQDCYHSIQKYVILGEMDALMEYMYMLCKSSHTPPPPHLVRFMAHIVLFLRMVGCDSKVSLVFALSPHSLTLNMSLSYCLSIITPQSCGAL
jgi:hypothetical protein